ncbi:MAG: rod shape-determining protein RodA [Pseudomonadota bacterium]
MELLKKFKINGVLFGAVMLLIIIGLVNLYSAVYNWEAGGTQSIFWSQLIWVLIGLVLMAVTIIIDYHLFESISIWFYILIISLLAAAVFFGVEVNGTRGWLKLGPFSIQPAEFSKLAYVLIAARYFGRHSFPEGIGFWELWKPALLVVIPFGLIIAQGDLGSAAFLVMIFGTFALFGGMKKKALIFLVVFALVGAIVVSTFFLKGYQRSRIFNFLHPESDMRGSGYHLVQSKIAVGSGKFFGKGYLKGNINKLRYLPERHTDFIFPVLAEEWGFLGSTVLIAMYLIIMLSAVEIAKRARDRFATFLAVGVTAILFWQVLVNLYGVLGLMPLTGVPLPFMSYGGSSMIALLVSMGILFNLDSKRFKF